MAYETLGEVRVVRLGGINPETGQKNPSSIEGYYVGCELRPNKYNKEKPQKFYTFKTKSGLDGIYGKGGLDKLMASATIGAMTKVTDTGELKDVGKGQPMKVYKVQRDLSNIDSSIGQVSSEETYSASSEDESDDSDLFGEESAADEVVVTTARRPTAAPAVNTAALQSKVQSLLNKSKASR